MKILFIILFILSFSFAKSQSTVDKTFFVVFTAEIGNSQKESVYKFKRDGDNSKDSIIGTGESIFFGRFTKPGNYSLFKDGIRISKVYKVELYQGYSIKEDITIDSGEIYKSNNTTGHYMNRFYCKEKLSLNADSIVRTNLNVL